MTNFETMGKIALTTADFISKAKKIHGDKYDYSKVNYVNSYTKVCIICPKHGEFWQTPYDHLQGCGCPKCATEKKAASNSQTTAEFISKAKEIHGDKYDYSKVNYVNARTKVCIICPKHGEFWQLPPNHLIGSGCPKCNRSHLERDMSDFLVSNKIGFVEQKQFEWLGRQSLDFYLPEYNIAIECQGKQHYKPINFAGLSKGKDWAIKEFNNTQSRDKRKAKLCESNGVNLLYYTENTAYESEFALNTFTNHDKLLNYIRC